MRVPQIRAKPKPTYAELQAENEALRERLERSGESPIQLSPGDNSLRIRDLHTPVAHIEELEVESSTIQTFFNKSLSVDSLTGKELVDPRTLARSSASVKKLKMTVPEATVNRFAAKEAAKNNVEDFKVQFHDGGEVSVSGKANKGPGIPFHLRGFVDLTDGGQVRMRLGQSRVFGFLPVPRFMMDMAASMSGKQLSRAGVVQKGDSFILDPQKFIPENIDFQLEKIETREGHLFIQGGSGVEESHNPKVLQAAPWGPPPQ
jgi:hypothetical protein